MISSLSIKNHYMTELARCINEIIILIPINKSCKINLNGSMITIDHACIINNADLYQYIDIENLIELKIPLPLFIEKDKSIVNAFFDIKQVKYIEQFRNLILQKLHNHIQNRKYMHLYISNIIEFLLKEAKVHLDDQYLPTLYTKHPLVQRLTQYIHKHINQPLTTKQVSKAFYISQSYISILFSKILNMNFKQYTSSLKIALSLFDLLEKEQSIYDVALKYSYTNVSTYSKNFKFYVKMPPKYYIHQFRKNDLNSPYQVSLSTSNLTKIINKMYNFSHNQHISSNQIVLDKLKYTHKFNVTRTFITFEDLHKLISFNRSNFSIKILSLISKPNLILLHTNFDDLNKLDYHNVFEAIKQLLIKGFEITLKVDNPPFSQTIDYQIIKILNLLTLLNDNISNVSLLVETNHKTFKNDQRLIENFKQQFPTLKCAVNVRHILENSGNFARFQKNIGTLNADYYFIDTDCYLLKSILSKNWFNSDNTFDTRQLIMLFLNQLHPSIAKKIIFNNVTHSNLKHYYKAMSVSPHILLMHLLTEFQTLIGGFAFPYFSEDDDQFMLVNHNCSTMPIVHVFSLLKPFFNLHIAKLPYGLIGKSKHHFHILLFNTLNYSTQKSDLVANIVHNYITDFPVYTRVLNENHGLISQLIPNNLDLSYIDSKILEQINNANIPLSKLTMHSYHNLLTIKVSESEIKYIMFPIHS